MTALHQADRNTQHPLLACYSHSPTHLPPTALHRQIKVLHEALARTFSNGYAERLTEGQTAFLPILKTHLMGVQ
jgi:hypothetical protein